MPNNELDNDVEKLLKILGPLPEAAYKPRLMVISGLPGTGKSHLAARLAERMDEIAASPRDLNACTYCGVLRRQALNTAAREIGADRLATAHNLDDMAQTALLNIFRGDTNRLAQIDPGGRDLPGFIRRIKPYAEIPEKESTLYAYLTGIPFQATPCPYADEAMRNDARDILNRLEHKRPGTKHTVYRTALKLAPNLQTRAPLTNCTTCGEPSPDTQCRACTLLQGLSHPEKT